MKTIYTVCGLGYDQNDKITDDELYFGEFDNYEKAYGSNGLQFCLG